jgi:hypothetical protein
MALISLYLYLIKALILSDAAVFSVRLKIYAAILSESSLDNNAVFSAYKIPSS